jgi:hypothetical protein
VTFGGGGSTIAGAGEQPGKTANPRRMHVAANETFLSRDIRSYPPACNRQLELDWANARKNPLAGHGTDTKRYF